LDDIPLRVNSANKGSRLLSKQTFKEIVCCYRDWIPTKQKQRSGSEGKFIGFTYIQTSCFNLYSW